MAEVTDPALLEQLNSPTEVTDPKLLAQLNGEEPHPSQQGKPEAFTATFLPFRFDPAKDRGHDAAVQEAGKAGPTIGQLPAYLAARGLNLAVPKFITDVLEANDRGAAGAYTDDETGQRQRTRDALTVASSIVPGDAALPVGRAAEAAASPVAERAAAAAVPSARDQALQAAERIGVDVPKAAAGNYAERAVGAALRDIPVVGEPMAQASEKALGQLEGAANKVADDLGGGSALSAGYVAKDSITHWIESGSKQEAAEVYAPARTLIGDAAAPLTSTNFVAQQIKAHAEEIGLKPPSVVGEVERAVAKGDLTFDQMQRLRTEIGDRMSGAIIPEPGQNEKALKALYGALSEDLDALAARAGDKAKAAWNQANDAFKTQIAAKRDQLVKIVGIEGEANAELVSQRLTTMASAKRGGDIDRLRLARETIGDGWGELASSVVANLGRTKDGFSIARFRTDYSNLSDAGKDLLFSTEHRQALDDIATVAKRFENLDRLANHSRSAVSGSIIGAGYAAISNPLSVLASALGGRAVSAMLARPATAQATAAWAKGYAALEEHATEQTYLVVRDAALRLRDVMDREGIPAYPPISSLIADQPLNDNPDEKMQ